MKVETRERLHAFRGGLYLSRSILVDGQTVATEYATQDEDGRLSWHECEEGVEFSSIQPAFNVQALLRTLEADFGLKLVAA